MLILKFGYFLNFQTNNLIYLFIYFFLVGGGGMKIFYIFLEITTKLDFLLGRRGCRGLISTVNCPFRVFFTVQVQMRFWGGGWGEGELVC